MTDGISTTNINIGAKSTSNIDTDGPIWRSIKAKGTPPSPRSGHTAVVYRNSMYVFGGRDGNTFKNDVFAFHFVTATWKEIATTGSRPLPRYGHRASLYDGKMVVFGGHGANTYLNDLLELDLDTFEWKRIAGGGPAPTPRWQHSMVIWRGELVIFGGCDSTSFLNDLYAFNFEHSSWRAITCDDYSIPPTPRMHHGAVTVGDKMYVFGGQTGDSVKSDLFEFDFALATWNFLGVYEDNFRRNFSCVYHKGNVIIMETGVFSKLLKFDGIPPSKRSGHTAEMYGNKMVVFGGLGNDGSQNDLFELYLGEIENEELLEDVEPLSTTPPLLYSGFSPSGGGLAGLASSPVEAGYFHRMRNGTFSDPTAYYNKDESPMLVLYREELQKLKADLEALRLENTELKKELHAMKSDSSGGQGSPYILI